MSSITTENAEPRKGGDGIYIAVVAWVLFTVLVAHSSLKLGSLAALRTRPPGDLSSAKILTWLRRPARRMPPMCVRPPSQTAWLRSLPPALVPPLAPAMRRAARHGPRHGRPVA
jgi:hypothetical protein